MAEIKDLAISHINMASIKIVSPSDFSLVQGRFHLHLSYEGDLSEKNVKLFANGKNIGTFDPVDQITIKSLPYNSDRRVVLTAAIVAGKKILSSSEIRLKYAEKENSTDDDTSTEKETKSSSNEETSDEDDIEDDIEDEIENVDEKINNLQLNERNEKSGDNGNNGNNGNSEKGGDHSRERTVCFKIKDGHNGRRGPPGPPGPTGPTGPKGNDGKDGCDGKCGPPGPKGSDGKNGCDGKRGPKGHDGCDGKRGPHGKDGCDGKNAECLVFSTRQSSDIPKKACAAIVNGSCRESLILTLPHHHEERNNSNETGPFSRSNLKNGHQLDVVNNTNTDVEIKTKDSDKILLNKDGKIYSSITLYAHSAIRFTETKGVWYGYFQ